MKNLNTYITEYIIKKKLDNHISPYKYCPQNINELIDIVSDKVKNMNNDKKIDLSDIDVSKITSLNNMLPLALKKIKYYDKINYIDVWGWDVKNIEDMSNTFAYELVHKIDGLDSWNVSF